MRLTERQINILAFLLNIDDWVTSEQLSVYLHLNKKLIQAEIRELIDSFGNEIDIEINKHKGYLLRHITEDSRQLLHTAANEFGGKNSLLVKRSTIVLYLLFLKDYISMQELADLFFMSKSAVSLEIEGIKRWMERYQGIDLEVNKQRGILVQGSEKVKRVYCAQHGTLQAFEETPFLAEIKKNYKTYLHLMREILSDLCVSYDFILTGEDFKKNTRFLAETVLRSRMGYVQEEVVQQEKWLAIVQQISEIVRRKIGYSFTTAEMSDIQLLLQESNTLIKKTNQELPLIKKRIQLFSQQVEAILGLNGLSLFKDSTKLQNYIEKMCQRESNGNVAINHYNEDIVLRYPLEVSICYRLAPEFFSKKVTKETSNIALYLASEFQPHKNRVSVLLVSNQCENIILQIECLIKQSVCFQISSFYAIPVYQFQNDSTIQNDFNMFLTTEQDILLKYLGFFLIPPIINNKDIVFLYYYLNRRFDDQILEQKNQLKNKYLSVFYIKKECVTEWSMETIIGEKQDEMTTYHTFNQDKIYVCRIHPEKKSRVSIYTMNEPLVFLQKKIRKIVYVNFRVKDTDIFLFFDMISHILNEL